MRPWSATSCSISRQRRGRPSASLGTAASRPCSASIFSARRWISEKASAFGQEDHQRHTDQRHNHRRRVVRVSRQGKFLHRPESRRPARIARSLPRHQGAKADPQASRRRLFTCCARPKSTSTCSASSTTSTSSIQPRFTGTLRKSAGSICSSCRWWKKPAIRTIPCTSAPFPQRPTANSLNTIFDEWVRHDIGKIFIQLFDESVRPFLGMEHALCIYRETCGDVPVVEQTAIFIPATITCCPNTRSAIFTSGRWRKWWKTRKQREFGQNKWTSLPKYCRECEVLSMCNGGCPKDRIIKTPDGEDGLNYLCAGLKGFFHPQQALFQKVRRAGGSRRTHRKTHGDRPRRRRQRLPSAKPVATTPAPAAAARNTNAAAAAPGPRHRQ